MLAFVGIGIVLAAAQSMNWVGGALLAAPILTVGWCAYLLRHLISEMGISWCILRPILLSSILPPFLASIPTYAGVWCMAVYCSSPGCWRALLGALFLAQPALTSFLSAFLLRGSSPVSWSECYGVSLLSILLLSFPLLILSVSGLATCLLGVLLAPAGSFLGYLLASKLRSPNRKTGTQTPPPGTRAAPGDLSPRSISSTFFRTGIPAQRSNQ